MISRRSEEMTRFTGERRSATGGQLSAHVAIKANCVPKSCEHIIRVEYHGMRDSMPTHNEP